MVDKIHHSNAAVKWIIALCLTAVIAVVGWTVTATMATRMQTNQDMQEKITTVQTGINNNNIRVSVLENKYDNIMDTLEDIKEMIRDANE